MNQSTSLGMTFNDEKRILARIALLLAVITCFLLPPLTTHAKDGAPTQEIIQKLEEAKSKAQKGHPKVSQRLVNTISKVRAQLSKIPPGKAKRPVDFSVHSTPLVHVKAHGDIQVYIYVTRWGRDEKIQLENLGATVEIADETYGIVQAWLPYRRIEEAADLDFITRITPPSYGEPQSGSVQTEGDAILNADDVRALGYTGSGVKVGVISIGATNIASAQQSGDLPSVTVLQSGLLNDEGTAMLEIVHDIAPDATLGFCGAGTSLELIQCVEELDVIFGADIIVDDIKNFLEPFFEDGPVAKTVTNAINPGLFYTTSAGNYAAQHYFDNFYPNSSYPSTHDFGVTAGGASDRFLDFSIPPNAELKVWLQWDEPFGGACSDYDLFLVDAQTNPLDSSINSQNCNSDPFEDVTYRNPFPYAVQVSVTIRKYSGIDRFLEMFYSLPPLQYNEPKYSIVGHAAVPGVMTVGAINANDPGNDDIANYSSQGPAIIAFPSVEFRNKPDITAIDGVSVTGAGGFPTTFPGTSAAAPHVAGVAALLMSADPTASATQISQAITSSAVDLGTPGFDDVYGHGRIDAISALESITLDSDNDSIPDNQDNCPVIPNPSQTDTDGDGAGDACDLDDDNDGIPDSVEDVNGNGIVDPGETDPLNPDTDGDGVADKQDNCPLVLSASQADNDNDGLGDACDTDDDNDGMPDSYELTNSFDPLNAADANADADGDGYSNLSEYRAGSDPRDPASVPKVVPMPWLPLLLE